MFGSDYTRENSILVRWNERMLIMHSYADVIQMKRANVHTCDKQVLWESAGAFFPGDNSLVSRGKSHSSRVRRLVVRCLLFNPKKR